MTPLERRYRLVLRLLPASYRAAWEEEMVAAFLQSMAATDPEDPEFVAEYGWPSRSEMASVVALAVRLHLPAARLRLGVPGAPPRYAASSAGVRRAALAMLLVHASFATMGLGMMLWPVRSSLISLAAGVAVATGFVVFGAHPDEAYLALLDRAGIYSVLVVAAALPYLLVVLVRPARRGSPWSLAFALLPAAVLGLRLVTLPDVPPAAVGAGLAQALALAVICVPLAALARQALRRLSPVRVDSGQGSLG